MAYPAAIVGNYNIDLVIGPVAEMPAWGTEIIVNTVLPRPAGSAGNTAQALGTLEMQCLPVGLVGTDGYGDHIIRELSGLGLPTNLLKCLPGAQTGVGFTILKEGGERTFITYLGSLEKYTDEHLLSAASVVCQSEFVLFAGYNLLPALSTTGIKKFFSTLKNAGCTLLFDPGWDVTGWQEDAVLKVQTLLPYVDYFLPNLAEAEAISGTRGDFVTTGRSLLELGPQAIVIKLGSDGAGYVHRDLTYHAEGVRAKAIDTTGAGDSFNAGLIYGLIQRWPIGEALAFANRLAAHVVQRLENRYPHLSDLA